MAKALIWIVLGFGAYAVALRQLAKAVQPLRLRLAEEGEALLAEGVLSAEDESDVQMFLGHAYNGWAIGFLMIMMPAAMFYLATGIDREVGGELPQKSARLGWWFLISILAANPFMGLLAIIEFMGLAAVVVIATGSVALLQAAVRRSFHSLAARQRAEA